HFVYWHICLCRGNRESCPCHKVFSIFSYCKTMVSCTVWDLEDLYSFKSGKIYSCNPWGVVFVCKYPAPIKFSIGLRDVKVVKVTPWHKTIRSIKHWLALFIITITFFSILGKYRNYF